MDFPFGRTFRLREKIVIRFRSVCPWNQISKAVQEKILAAAFATLRHEQIHANIMKPSKGGRTMRILLDITNYGKYIEIGEGRHKAYPVASIVRRRPYLAIEASLFISFNKIADVFLNRSLSSLKSLWVVWKTTFKIVKNMCKNKPYLTVHCIGCKDPDCFNAV